MPRWNRRVVSIPPSMTHVVPPTRGSACRRAAYDTAVWEPGVVLWGLVG
jgi:hypothetical protein